MLDDDISLAISLQERGILPYSFSPDGPMGPKGGSRGEGEVFRKLLASVLKCNELQFIAPRLTLST